MTGVDWIWIYSGVGMMLAELVLPGFILCFFGLAAVTVGVLGLLVGEAFSLTWQLAAFSVLSVLYIWLLRRWFKRALTGTKSGDGELQGEYVGRTGRIVKAIEPPLAGRVMIGDAEWTAEADAPIAEGKDVKVVSQHNLTMKVEVI